MKPDPTAPGQGLDWSRWNEIDSLFAQALDLPAEARARFLEEITADRRLQEAVRRLLAAAGATDSFSGVLSSDQAREALESAAEEPLPSRIGPFRIVRALGRGGMGTVLLAERVTSDFRQVVALKVLRRGLDTDDLLRRFRAERRILAALKHPHIAALVDGGSTDGGRPWLAMEYVDGVPLPDYCRARALGPRERIRLVRSVAIAVQEAHRNLIVHRDIKPSNVLVTGDGVPKLLDFGIAKLLDDDADGSGDADTRTGFRLLTPRYASPEQRRGERVSTATDIYQLGVLLVEVLTGSRPESDSLAGTVPAGLKGDLARIAAMALRADPTRRYPTASALVEDLERWLDGRPVAARPDSWSYRTRKFLQRHRWLVPAAALILLVGAGWLATTVQHTAEVARERDVARGEALRADAERGLAVLAREEARAERNVAVAALERADSLHHVAEGERDGAEAQRIRAEAALAQATLDNQRAEQTTRFLVGLFRSPDIAREPRADTLSARTLLVRGAERVRTELADQPLVLATLLGTLGEISLGLGLDGHDGLLADALALERSVRGDEDPRLALTLMRQGSLYLTSRGFALAAPRFAEAIRIWRAVPGSSAETLAGALVSHAIVLSEVGEVDQAEAALREAMAIHERLGQADGAQNVLAQSSLAVILRRQNRYAEAETMYQRVLAAQRQAADTPRLTLASSLNNLGFLLRTLERYEEAERAYREAFDLQVRAAPPTQRSTNVVANNLAAVLADMDRNDEAAEVLAGEIARHRQHFPPDHVRIGMVTGSLAIRLEISGRHPEAEPLRREQVAVYTASLGDNHSWSLRARVHLGQLLAILRSHEEAEAHLLTADALAVAVRDTAAQGATQAMVRAALVRFYEALDRSEDAARYRIPDPR